MKKSYLPAAVTFIYYVLKCVRLSRIKQYRVLILVMYFIRSPSYSIITVVRTDHWPVETDRTRKNANHKNMKSIQIQNVLNDNGCKQFLIHIPILGR